jgi:outer membrane protein assembly factor BamA
LRKESFVSEIAFNTGIGLRFDLSMFLFRIDWGIPLRDPSKPPLERWVLAQNFSNNFSNFLSNQTAIAIGIGYPF